MAESSTRSSDRCQAGCYLSLPSKQPASTVIITQKTARRDNAIRRCYCLIISAKSSSPVTGDPHQHRTNREFCSKTDNIKRNPKKMAICLSAIYQSYISRIRITPPYKQTDGDSLVRTNSLKLRLTAARWRHRQHILFNYWTISTVKVSWIFYLILLTSFGISTFKQKSIKEFCSCVRACLYRLRMRICIVCACVFVSFAHACFVLTFVSQIQCLVILFW